MLHKPSQIGQFLHIFALRETFSEKRNIKKFRFNPLGGGRQFRGAATDKSLMMGGDVTRLNLSNATAAGLLEENPGVRATEALFSEFLTTVSAAGGRGVESALDSIAEFEQTVADHVDVLR